MSSYSEPTEPRKDRQHTQLFGGHVDEEIAYESNVLLAMEAMTKTDWLHLKMADEYKAKGMPIPEKLAARVAKIKVRLSRSSFARKLWSDGH
jgi:hypothetical protein